MAYRVHEKRNLCFGDLVEDIKQVIEYVRALETANLGLKGRMEALEASCSEEHPGHPEDAPTRETGWAVVGTAAYVNLVFTCSGFEARADRSRVLWLRSAYLASDLAAALGAGRPALLYKDTLEEVP